MKIKKAQLKEIIKSIVKEVLKESLPSVPSMEKTLTNDDRITFAIDMDGKVDWVVQYKGKPVGDITRVDTSSDKNDEKTLFKFTSTDPDFEGLNNKTGTAKILKVNFIRWVDFKLKNK